MVTFLAFIFVFSLIVFVHEFGHFITARIFGVRVEEFAFGFPPRIWSKKGKKTEYAINLLPIGGYVRLFGEDGERSKEKDNLQNKKPWQKAVIFAAGVIMNFLLAWFLLTGFYLIGGKSFISGMEGHKGVINTQQVFVTDVVKGSPAEKNDLQKGDQIISVDGKEVSGYEAVFAAVQEAKVGGKKEVALTIKRGDQLQEKKLATYTEKIQDGKNSIEVERVGISMDAKGKIMTPFYLAPIVGIQEEVRIAKLTIVGFGGFFKQIFTEFRISQDVGGPIAIVQMSGNAARLGASALLQFVVILSVTLGVLNILPFPALDGGHILFLAIEKIMGREIPTSVKETINKIGFGLLLLLIAVVTFKDLTRIF